MQEAVTLPNNFVTVFHALTTDLDIETPWPKPSDYVPENSDKPFLVWGGSSSVGQFAIQILRYYGYSNILTTASSKHHSKLFSFGAKQTFDYKSASVVDEILKRAGEEVKWVLDCIGSKDGSLAPLAKIVKKGAKVAVLLPVIVRNSSETQDPIYDMDVGKAASWAAGVNVRGVRTHFYLNVSYGLQFVHCLENTLAD
jgi:NADPH:quinone reductase-like Zn-dependent oxidoreductase